MGFDSYGAGAKDSTNKKEVDWDALNKYVVEAAGLEQPETVVGYVAGIVDLGTQEQEDAEVIFTGTAEDEADEIDDKPATYFKDGTDEKGKPVRLKCWPQKPIQCVAVAVDFPDIVIDKGQFFGESNPQPLRMWLGDSFYMKNTGSIISRPTPLKINKSLGVWSFDKKHLFYKMALGAKLIKDGEAFLPESIDKLLGKAFQFTVNIFMRKGSDGKQYFTERIKFSASLGRGQVSPELVNDPFLIQFNRTNNAADLKQLRNHVVNTIKRAANYSGSVIEKELIANGLAKEGDAVKAEEPSKEEAKPVAKAPVKQTKVKPVPDLQDDDLPF